MGSLLLEKLDLVCFSYLSSARVLQIENYPQLDSGAEVGSFVDTLAADGPMVAIAVACLGLKTGLIANSLGADRTGWFVKDKLQENAVVNTVENLADKETPFIVVLSDLEGSREWFAFIKNVREELAELELTQIDNTSLVYIDLYSGIKKASLRAVDYANSKGVPVFLNLSGEVPDVGLMEELAGRDIVVTQIGLRESREDEAEEIARDVLGEVGAEISIVTLASKGAIAVDSDSVVRAPALPVDIFHVHGAGAAFSAGFIFGYLSDWSLQRSLKFATTFGSLSCTKERGFEEFTLGEIKEVLKNQERPWRGK